jgi:hypothetical protein
MSLEPDGDVEWGRVVTDADPRARRGHWTEWAYPVAFGLWLVAMAGVFLGWWF